MSQAAPSDSELSTDSGPPSAHPPPHTGPVPQDVPTSPEPPVPEPADHPRSAEEPDASTDATEGEVRAPAEGQVTECDQTVSLEPEADGSEEEVNYYTKRMACSSALIMDDYVLKLTMGFM